jgi:hypothetical protein
LGGGGAFAANTWTTISMTGGSGSKAITHGDLVAVVIDMTARGGADTITTTAGISQGSASVYQVQGISQFTGGAWTAASGIPNCVIVFDDGTLGIIDVAFPFVSLAQTEAFADGSNPDERGMVFQIPWDCKVDALFTQFLTGGADADFNLNLYSAPTTSPSLIASRSVDSDQHQTVAAQGFATFPLAAEVELSKDTDYCLAVRATGTNNVTVTSAVLADEDFRVFFPGGTTLAKATRNNGSGAFSLESPAITMIQLGVRISAFVAP